MIFGGLVFQASLYPLVPNIKRLFGRMAGQLSFRFQAFHFLRFFQVALDAPTPMAEIGFFILRDAEEEERNRTYQDCR
jgi:hypothetical protein